ncbi:streptococcal hemagglutinin-like [Littorina saxatilis]|uniref:streptococcal hemagglutinin-like n=1 Tax=Littorina saxatilis TaxID=31220 RepID=UPI0038B5C3BE
MVKKLDEMLGFFPYAHSPLPPSPAPPSSRDAEMDETLASLDLDDDYFPMSPVDHDSDAEADNTPHESPTKGHSDIVKDMTENSTPVIKTKDNSVFMQSDAQVSSPLIQKGDNQHSVQNTAQNQTPLVQKKDNKHSVQDTVQSNSPLLQKKVDQHSVQDTVQSSSPSFNKKDNLESVQNTVRSKSPLLRKKNNSESVQDRVQSSSPSLDKKDNLDSVQDTVQSSSPSLQKKDETQPLQHTAQNNHPLAQKNYNPQSVQDMIKGSSPITEKKDNVDYMPSVTVSSEPSVNESAQPNSSAKSTSSSSAADKSETRIPAMQQSSNSVSVNEEVPQTNAALKTAVLPLEDFSLSLFGLDDIVETTAGSVETMTLKAESPVKAVSEAEKEVLREIAPRRVTRRTYSKLCSVEDTGRDRESRQVSPAKKNILERGTGEEKVGHAVEEPELSRVSPPAQVEHKPPGSSLQKLQSPSAPQQSLLLPDSSPSASEVVEKLTECSQQKILSHSTHQQSLSLPLRSPSAAEKGIGKTSVAVDKSHITPPSQGLPELLSAGGDACNSLLFSVQIAAKPVTSVDAAGDATVKAPGDSISHDVTGSVGFKAGDSIQTGDSCEEHSKNTAVNERVTSVGAAGDATLKAPGDSVSLDVTGKARDSLQLQTGAGDSCKEHSKTIAVDEKSEVTALKDVRLIEEWESDAQSDIQVGDCASANVPQIVADSVDEEREKTVPVQCGEVLSPPLTRTYPRRTRRTSTRLLSLSESPQNSQNPSSSQPDLKSDQTEETSPDGVCMKRTGIDRLTVKSIPSRTRRVTRGMSGQSSSEFETPVTGVSKEGTVQSCDTDTSSPAVISKSDVMANQLVAVPTSKDCSSVDSEKTQKVISTEASFSQSVDSNMKSDKNESHSQTTAASKLEPPRMVTRRTTSRTETSDSEKDLSLSLMKSSKTPLCSSPVPSLTAQTVSCAKKQKGNFGLGDSPVKEQVKTVDSLLDEFLYSPSDGTSEEQPARTRSRKASEKENSEPAQKAASPIKRHLVFGDNGSALSVSSETKTTVSFDGKAAFSNSAEVNVVENGDRGDCGVQSNLDLNGLQGDLDLSSEDSEQEDADDKIEVHHQRSVNQAADKAKKDLVVVKDKRAEYRPPNSTSKTVVPLSAASNGVSKRLKTSDENKVKSCPQVKPSRNIPKGPQKGKLSHPPKVKETEPPPVPAKSDALSTSSSASSSEADDTSDLSFSDTSLSPQKTLAMGRGRGRGRGRGKGSSQGRGRRRCAVKRREQLDLFKVEKRNSQSFQTSKGSSGQKRKSALASNADSVQPSNGLDESSCDSFKAKSTQQEKRTPALGKSQDIQLPGNLDNDSSRDTSPVVSPRKKKTVPTISDSESSDSEVVASRASSKAKNLRNKKSTSLRSKKTPAIVETDSSDSETEDASVTLGESVKSSGKTVVSEQRTGKEKIRRPSKKTPAFIKSDSSDTKTKGASVSKKELLKHVEKMVLPTQRTASTKPQKQSKKTAAVVESDSSHSKTESEDASVIKKDLGNGARKAVSLAHTNEATRHQVIGASHQTGIESKCQASQPPDKPKTTVPDDLELDSNDTQDYEYEPASTSENLKVTGDKFDADKVLPSVHDKSEHNQIPGAKSKRTHSTSSCGFDVENASVCSTSETNMDTLDQIVNPVAESTYADSLDTSAHGSVSTKTSCVTIVDPLAETPMTSVERQNVDIGSQTLLAETPMTSVERQNVDIGSQTLLTETPKDDAHPQPGVASEDPTEAMFVAVGTYHYENHQYYRQASDPSTKESDCLLMEATREENVLGEQILENVFEGLLKQNSTDVKLSKQKSTDVMTVEKNSDSPLSKYDCDGGQSHGLVKNDLGSGNTVAVNVVNNTTESVIKAETISQNSSHSDTVDSPTITECEQQKPEPASTLSEPASEQSKDDASSLETDIKHLRDAPSISVPDCQQLKPCMDLCLSEIEADCKRDDSPIHPDLIRPEARFLNLDRSSQSSSSQSSVAGEDKSQTVLRRSSVCGGERPQVIHSPGNKIAFREQTRSCTVEDSAKKGLETAIHSGLKPQPSSQESNQEHEPCHTQKMSGSDVKKMSGSDVKKMSGSDVKKMSGSRKAADTQGALGHTHFSVKNTNSSSRDYLVLPNIKTSFVSASVTAHTERPQPATGHLAPEAASPVQQILPGMTSVTVLQVQECESKPEKPNDTSGVTKKTETSTDKNDSVPSPGKVGTETIGLFVPETAEAEMSLENVEETDLQGSMQVTKTSASENTVRVVKDVPVSISAVENIASASSSHVQPKVTENSGGKQINSHFVQLAEVLSICNKCINNRQLLSPLPPSPVKRKRRKLDPDTPTLHSLPPPAPPAAGTRKRKKQKKRQRKESQALGSEPLKESRALESQESESLKESPAFESESFKESQLSESQFLSDIAKKAAQYAAKQNAGKSPQALAVSEKTATCQISSSSASAAHKTQANRRSTVFSANGGLMRTASTGRQSSVQGTGVNSSTADHQAGGSLPLNPVEKAKREMLKRRQAVAGSASLPASSAPRDSQGSPTLAKAARKRKAVETETESVEQQKSMAASQTAVKRKSSGEEPEPSQAKKASAARQFDILAGSLKQRVEAVVEQFYTVSSLSVEDVIVRLQQIASLPECWLAVIQSVIMFLKKEDKDLQPEIVRACTSCKSDADMNNLRQRMFMDSTEIRFMHLLLRMMESHAGCERIQLMQTLWAGIFLPNSTQKTSITQRPALCRLFAGLCSAAGCTEEVRVLVFHVVLMKYYNFVTVILAVAAAWPAALTRTPDTGPAGFLVALENIVMTNIAENPAMAKLSQCFGHLCGWETTSTQDSAKVLAKHINTLRMMFNSEVTPSSSRVYELSGCIEMLCSANGPAWMLKHFLMRTFRSVASKWSSKGETEISPHYAAAVCRLVGRVVKAELKERDKVLTQIFQVDCRNLIASPHKHPAVEEACVDLLLLLAPLKPPMVFSVLHDWYTTRPDPVSRQLKDRIVSLRNLIKSRAPFMSLDSFY